MDNDRQMHRLRLNGSASVDKTKRERWSKDQLVEIYIAYPRHVGKLKAIAAIGKALGLIADEKDTDAHEWLIERVRSYKESQEGRHDRQFIPMPATWMNQGRYDDDPEEWEMWKTNDIPNIQKTPQQIQGERLINEWESRREGASQ